MFENATTEQMDVFAFLFDLGKHEVVEGEHIEGFGALHKIFIVEQLKRIGADDLLIEKRLAKLGY